MAFTMFPSHIDSLEVAAEEVFEGIFAFEGEDAAQAVAAFVHGVDRYVQDAGELGVGESGGNQLGQMELAFRELRIVGFQSPNEPSAGFGLYLYEGFVHFLVAEMACQDGGDFACRGGVGLRCAVEEAGDTVSLSVSDAGH